MGAREFAVGLRLAKAVSLEDWRATGHELMGTVASMPWLLGDWYLCGLELARRELENRGKRIEDRPSGKASALSSIVCPLASSKGTEPTHLELAALVRKLFNAGDTTWKTARNAAVVCRAFEPSRRRDGLSFRHHETVCAFTVREQERLLNRAEKEELSVADLRERIREGKRPRGEVLLHEGRPYLLGKHVAEMVRWLREQDLELPGRAEALAEELRPIVEFVEELKREA